MHMVKVGVQDAVSGNSVAAKDPRLERSAHDFEASLMAELLKPLQETDGLTGEDSGTGGGGSGDALQSFASESLARAITERGGFGIAARILRQLDRTGVSASGTTSKDSIPGDLKVS